MIDIHSHLLYGVDDGCKSIDESISIIKHMGEVGYTDIIITPHYICDSYYSSSKSDNLVLFEELKKALVREDIDVNIYLGNEIYIDGRIDELLDNGLISSLNDSMFLLIELPMSGEYEGYIDEFEHLISLGYKVILAHPERYLAFQRDFNKVYELEKIGVYFQSNLESILGSYGKGAKKMIKRLLKEKKISFLASDIHHRKRDYGKFMLARKKMGKFLSSADFDVLLKDNPKKILN